MRFRELNKLLRQDGRYEIAKVGSHHQYKHPSKAEKVTVPEHAGRDIRPETVRSIKKQAGLN